MEWLLRAKHWVIFVITIGIYLLHVVVGRVILGAYVGLEMLHYTAIFITLFSFTGRSLWQFAIITRVNARLSHDLQTNLIVFMLMFYMQFVYKLFISLYALTLTLIPFGTFRSWIDDMISSVSEANIAGIGIMTVFSLSCSLYFAYLIAKLLAVHEQQQNVKIGDFFGNLILVAFFPIGVWWIQPRVNNIFGGQEEELTFDAPLDHNLNS